MTYDAFVFIYLRPDGRWGAIADRNGRLIVTRYEMLAEAFRVLLGRRGMNVIALKRNPMEVAALVTSCHVAVTDVTAHVEFIESDECDDAEDALWRTIEMANAIPGDTPGDWNAAHAERVRT